MNSGRAESSGCVMKGFRGNRHRPATVRIPKEKLAQSTLLKLVRSTVLVHARFLYTVYTTVDEKTMLQEH